MIPVHLASVKQGKLILKDRQAFNIWVESLTGEVEVIVRKPRKNRTDDQNSYYWGVVLETIATETGHTTDELHEIFKRMFLIPKAVEYRGREIKMPGSTVTLTTKEFTDYIERIKVEVGEMGIKVPEANQAE